MGTSWGEAKGTPRWRIERDLAYYGIEMRSRAYALEEMDRDRDRNEAKERVRNRALGRG